MSKLVIRRATEADHPWLKEMGLDLRGVKSRGSHTCICEEGGKRIGAALGWKGSEDTATLAGVPIAPDGRIDVLLSLVEWHNSNAIALGCKWSEVGIPVDGQCTHVMETAPLLEYIERELRPDINLEIVDAGRNMRTGKIVGRRLQKIDLQTAAVGLAKRLDALGCEREWV